MKGARMAFQNHTKVSFWAWTDKCSPLVDLRHLPRSRDSQRSIWRERSVGQGLLSLPLSHWWQISSKLLTGLSKYLCGDWAAIGVVWDAFSLLFFFFSCFFFNVAREEQEKKRGRWRESDAGKWLAQVYEEDLSIQLSISTAGSCLHTFPLAYECAEQYLYHL